MNAIRLSLLIVLVSSTSPALAHTDGGPDTSFLSGLLHPITGADHVLTMLAVGVWARLIGGRALPTFMASFLIAMLAGSIMATAGVAVSGVEIIIAGSALVLWTVIILKARPPLVIGSTLCAGLALVHGFAHGAEMAAGLSRGPYAVGFLLADRLPGAGRQRFAAADEQHVC